MHDALIIALIVIFAALVIVGIHVQGAHSFTVPSMDRAQYGSKVRPTIDSQTIIQETIPDGREGVLYHDRYQTPDLQEKQSRFFNLITGGISTVAPAMPLASAASVASAAPRESTAPRASTLGFETSSAFVSMPSPTPSFIVVNGKKCDGNMRELTGLPVPDTTPIFTASGMVNDVFSAAVMARPFTRNVRDLRTATQKRVDMQPYLDTKKSDRVIPSSFGGA